MWKIDERLMCFMHGDNKKILENLILVNIGFNWKISKVGPKFDILIQCKRIIGIS